MCIENKEVQFANWMLTHSEEVPNTVSPCRRYKHIHGLDDWEYHNKVFTVAELIDIYLKFNISHP